MDNQFFNSPLFLALVTAFATLIASLLTSFLNMYQKEIKAIFKEIVRFFVQVLNLDKKYSVGDMVYGVQFLLSFALLVLLSVITIQLLVIDVFEPSLKRKALAVSLWICGYLSYKLTRKMRTL